MKGPSWTLGGNRLNDDIAAADQNVGVGAHLDVAEQAQVPAAGLAMVTDSSLSPSADCPASTHEPLVQL